MGWGGGGYSVFLSVFWAVGGVRRGEGTQSFSLSFGQWEVSERGGGGTLSFCLLGSGRCLKGGGGGGTLSFSLSFGQCEAGGGGGTLSFSLSFGQWEVSERGGGGYSVFLSVFWAV